MAAKGGVNHHPFSDLIMCSALPEGFKLPTMEKYDGLSDAEEHLAVFNAHMLFYGYTATDDLKCRVFPTTLTKFAIRWFFTLPANSIKSFSDLSAKFLERHALTISVQKSSRAIRDFQQGPHESLRDYINRFNQVAIHTIKEGLNPGPFGDWLVMRPPPNLVELQRIASCFINMEEEREEEQEREQTKRHW